MLNQSLNFIKKIKNSFFPFYRNKELKFVFDTLQKGFPKETVVARFVGGCVRKFLKYEKIDDIDIATILNSNEIKNKFNNTKFKLIDTGIKHGTVTLISDQLKLELTTLRKDVETDGRHAEVEYINDWQLDSERRDFTINAIYMDINGKIFDPQSGIFDLKNNNVKFIGDPNLRIQEDYLRIIRLLRFAIQYDSSNDKTTIDALKLNLSGIKKISKERILNELLKILNLKNFDNILKHENKKKIFSLVFPEFKYLGRLEKLYKVKEFININQYFLLVILLIDQNNNHEYFAYKYNVSNKIKKELELFNQLFLQSLKNKNFFEKDIEKNIYLYGKKQLIYLNTLIFTENINFKIADFLRLNKAILEAKTHKFTIDGEYLVSKGVKEGPLVGKVLKEIESQWIENGFEISKDSIKKIIKFNLD
ncbi:CCA tRNA nucleotidyltransferase [Pelagibacteraceae bacterium]|jgi:poly(A) polymerase|nr:CCA tRNA nucleotidyltransferase [Pelagibacteraceae bacterium]